MTSKLKRGSSIHKKTNPNELVVLKKLEKFERISLWSGRGESNPRHSLGKAVFEPLNYVRVSNDIYNITKKHLAMQVFFRKIIHLSFYCCSFGSSINGSSSPRSFSGISIVLTLYVLLILSYQNILFNMKL